ncbi:MAG: endo alpha-1,4 polygalactosaminidase [Alphaproteobacteria bacterium]|nr:endo alpha-1,4 polygalactosaminidase [Alphaproteobacteria bacterium]
MLTGCTGLTWFGSTGPEGRSGDGQADTACAEGSICNPVVVGAMPFVHHGDTRNAPAALDHYGCAPGTSEAGGEVVYRVDLVRAGRLTAAIDEIAGDGVDVDVHLLSGTDPAADCVARDHIGVDEDLEAGTYWIVVDTWTNSRGVPQAGPYTLTVGFEPDPFWRPSQQASWHWQLAGAVAADLPVDVAVLDLYAAEGAIEAQGAKVVCSFSAGTAEDWRDDTGAFPFDGVGLAAGSWLGVYWLDVRHPGVRSVIAARLDEAAARGCAAVEPRDLDGYAYDSGFALTADDARDYAWWLSVEAHARGLSIGLRDLTGLAPSLEPGFEFAVSQGCLASGTCGAYDGFTAVGKAVLHAEIRATPADAEASLDAICGDPARERFSTIVKTPDLSYWQLACPQSDLFTALSDLTSSCVRLSGTSDFRSDSGGARTIPICGLDGAVWWTSDFDVDCDGGTQSSCTSDPYYQSQTAAVDSNGHYLDANELPYVVVPGSSFGFDYRTRGLSMGSVVAVLYDGQVQFAVIGDVGPSGVVGEGSYALAEALGMNPHPIAGGVAGGVTYIHFTGSDARVQPIEDQTRAFDLGVEQAWQLVQDN